MIAREIALMQRRRTPVAVAASAAWPASRLNGTSPIRLLAAATLLTLGVALSAGRAADASASAAPATREPAVFATEMQP
jgi:hypothetical protein